MEHRAILGFIGVLAGFMSSCIAIGPQRSTEPRTITYQVSGTAFDSNITYSNATNGTTHVKSGLNVAGKMAWEQTVTLPAGAMAYLSAQNDNRKGSVIVEIYEGSRLIKSSESNGEYCIATVSD